MEFQQKPHFEGFNDFGQIQPARFISQNPFLAQIFATFAKNE